MSYIKQMIALTVLFIFFVILLSWAITGEEHRTTANNTQNFPFLGINYPWYHYGHDFGVILNEVHDGVSSEASQAEIEAHFAQMEQHGVQVVRWFILPDGYASPDFDAEGYVTGLDEYFYDDLDAALAIAERHHMKLIAVILDFYWFDSSNGSLSISVLDKRQRFFAHALVPLLERYGSDERILAWDVINEPEWAMTIPEGNKIEHPISASMMQEFVGEVAELIHEKATQPVTVGSASLATLEYWTEVGLDFYQFHYYNDPERLEDVPSYSELGLDKAVIVGEFPTQGSQYSIKQYLNAFWNQGYLSALAWSYRANDDATDFLSQAPAYCEWAKKHILNSSASCPSVSCPDHLDSPQGSVPLDLKVCSPDGTRYASELEAAEMGKIGIFDRSSDNLLTVIETNEQNNKLKAIAWSPDSSLLAYIYHHSGSQITLVDSHSAQLVRIINKEKWYHYMEYSPDGRYLLLAVDTEEPELLDTWQEGSAIKRLYLPLLTH